MIDRRLLAKIRKCLALSRSSNEHEAAAALAKARALMDEHGIDENLLEMADFEEASARASRNQRPPRWEGMLAATVCHALSAVQFINRDGDRQFVGRGARAEIASYAFAVLYRQLRRARTDYIAKHLRRCKPGRKRARADVFCEGWAVAVLVKIRELLPKPAEDEALNRYLELTYPHLQTVQARGANMARAANDYWRGVEGGHAVELNVGVGASAAPLALA